MKIMLKKMDTVVWKSSGVLSNAEPLLKSKQDNIFFNQTKDRVLRIQ